MASLIANFLLSLLARLIERRHLRRWSLFLLRRPLVAGTVSPDQVLSWSGEMWWAVPTEKMPKDSTDVVEVMRCANSHGVPLGPLTFVLGLSSELDREDEALLVRDIYVRVLSRETHLDMSDYTLVVDGVPQAGGPGTDAWFRVSFRAGLDAPIALMGNPRARGAVLSDIELRPGDVYRAALRLRPDGPGRYEFDIRIRCFDGRREWMQNVGQPFVLWMAPPETLARSGEVVRTFVGMQLVGVYPQLSEGAGPRAEAPLEIGANDALAVEAHVERRALFRRGPDGKLTYTVDRSSYDRSS